MRTLFSYRVLVLAAAALLVLAFPASAAQLAGADPGQLSASDRRVGLGPSLAGCGGAVATVDQSVEAGTLRFDHVWTPYAYRAWDSVEGVALAQTVTVGRPGLLTGVALHLVGWRVTNDLPVEVRARQPEGRLLAQGVLPLIAFEPWKSATNLVGAPSWIDVPLEPTVRVAPGEVLAIVLPALAGTQATLPVQWPTMIRWYTSADEDGYEGGSAFAGDRMGTDPGVSSWTQFRGDRHFRTYVCELPPTSSAAQPRPPVRGDPSAVLVVAVAFFAGALAARRVRRSLT